MLRHAMVLLLLLTAPLIAVGQSADTPVVRAAVVRAAREPDALPAQLGRAQGARPLTLVDFEAIATRHSPVLAGAAARIDASRGRRLQAGLYPNPILGYHATEIGNRDTAGQQGAFAAQRIITAGKLRLDREIAGKVVDEAHYLFHAQQQRVLSDVRVRFYDVLAAQRRVQLTNELVRIGEELVKATAALIEGNLVTDNDMLQAEIRSDESLILLDNASNQLMESWRRLVAVSGVPTMPIRLVSGKLDGNPPEFTWEDCYGMALGNNPAVQAARMRVQRAQVAVRRARREPIPNVDVSVSVRHHNVTQDDVTNVQVGLPIPIFNRNQGNIRAAEADWIAACNELKRLELFLQDRLAVAYRRYANARQQTARYRQRMVPKAQRSLNLVTNGYKQGQVKYLTLLNAQQTYVRINLLYLDSLRELRASSSIIEGQLLTDSLARNPGGRTD